MARPPSAPDLVRSIYLLCGRRPTQGRSGLSVESIVKAAIDLADEQGLTAVSMRKVATHLDVGTMSLYAYVPGKEDLLALMVDTAYGELYGDNADEAAEQGDWRAGVRFVAKANWELFQRHPWLLDLRLARPVLGPHASRKFEVELRPLDGIGLSDVAMESALTMILNHVESIARSGRRTHDSQDDSGMTEMQWWAIVGPALDQVIDDDQLVVSGRVGMAVGEHFQSASASPQHALDFGLNVILDGIGAQLNGS